MKPAPPEGTARDRHHEDEMASLEALALFDVEHADERPPRLPDGALDLLRVWWADTVAWQQMPTGHPARATLSQRVERGEHALERCLTTNAIRLAQKRTP